MFILGVVADKRTYAERREYYLWWHKNKGSSEEAKKKRRKRDIERNKLPHRRKYNLAFHRKKNYKRKYRIGCIEHYSNGKNECACCHTKHIEFLCIDHIYGGGNKHRKRINRSGSAFSHELTKLGYPDGYRVLCRNCNWGVHVGKGICPHERD